VNPKTLKAVKDSPEVKQLRKVLRKYGAEISFSAAGTGLILLTLYGSVIVANAALLAVVTTTGILLVSLKLPKQIQKALVKHGLWTDAAAAIGTYTLLGKSVTSLLAAGFVGCMVSALIWVVKPYVVDEEDDDCVQISIEIV
jgi:hypothetical protein